MIKQKSIIINTSLMTGIFLFFLLAAIPSLITIVPLNNNYEKIKTFIVNGYNKTEIPSINYFNNEIRSNNDIPFKKVFNSQNANGEFYFLIDTSINPNNENLNWFKKGAGGIGLFRKEAHIYASKQKNEQIIRYDDIPMKFNVNLNADFIHNILSRFKNIFILVVAAFKFIGHIFGKFILWGIVALIYSSKAKILGGGNYSLALWSLVPPTIFQIFMSFFPALACCGFIIYYIIWVVSFITFEKKLVPIAIEA